MSRWWPSRQPAYATTIDFANEVESIESIHPPGRVCTLTAMRGWAMVAVRAEMESPKRF